MNDSSLRRALGISAILASTACAWIAVQACSSDDSSSATPTGDSGATTPDGGTNADSGTNPDGSSTISAKFVLVHGAFQGQWCWSDVAAGLTARGATVKTLDLPGHGDDMTSPTAVNLDLYVSAINAAIDAVGPPVVLVGHSMGGIPVTQTAEKYPSKISKLVYLGAYFPKNGDSLQALAMMDPDSKLGPNLTVDADAGVGKLPMDKLKDIFCADCNDAQTANLLAHYRDEPLASLVATVTTTDANWGSVPKYYVHTLQDHAVTYKLQQTMVSGITLTKETSLDTSHCPFLSVPSQVVDALGAL